MEFRKKLCKSFTEKGLAPTFFTFLRKNLKLMFRFQVDLVPNFIKDKITRSEDA